MALRYKHRRDTAANYTSNNPILEDGELAFETDTGKSKLGDGVTAWNSLSYTAGGGASGSGTEIGLGERTFDSDTTFPAPDQGIKYNNATVSSVTQINIDDQDTDGQDRSAAIAEITATSHLIIAVDNDNFHSFKVVSITDNTGHFTIVVTYLESKGSVSNGQAVSVNVDLKEDISGKADKPVEEVWSSELLFDEDWKVREHTLTQNEAYTVAVEGNESQKIIEDYVTGDGSSSLDFSNIPNRYFGTSINQIDTNKVNGIIIYRDKNNRHRITIEHLETVIGLTQLATPTNVQAVSGGTSSINITWDAVANASNYDVEVSDNGTSGWTLLGNTSNTNISDSGLSEGVTKYYRVKAKGDGITYSDSPYSSVANATTSSGNTLDTPILTVVTNDSITNSLSWTNVSGESGFQLERSDDGTTGWTTIYTAAVNELTHDDATCNPDQQYFYRVKALGDGGSILDSAYSTVKSVITESIITPTLSVVTSGDSELKVTIGSIDPNVDSIALTRDTNSDYSTEVAVEEYVSPNSSVADGSLVNGTLYYYRVQVIVNGVGSTYATANKLAAGLVMTDDFAGTTINATKWIETDPSDGVTITQNDELIFTITGTVASTLTNNLVSNDTITEGTLIATLGYTGNRATQSSALIALRDDSGADKSAQILKDSDGTTSLIIRNSGTVYSQDTAIQFNGTTFKITIDASNNIHFYHESSPNAWTELDPGTAKQYDLGVNKHVFIGANGVASTGTDTFTVDDVELYDEVI